MAKINILRIKYLVVFAIISQACELSLDDLNDIHTNDHAIPLQPFFTKKKCPIYLGIKENSDKKTIDDLFYIYSIYYLDANKLKLKSNNKYCNTTFKTTNKGFTQFSKQEIKSLFSCFEKSQDDSVLSLLKKQGDYETIFLKNKNFLPYKKFGCDLQNYIIQKKYVKNFQLLHIKRELNKHYSELPFSLKKQLSEILHFIQNKIHLPFESDLFFGFVNTYLKYHKNNIILKPLYTKNFSPIKIKKGIIFTFLDQNGILHAFNVQGETYNSVFIHKKLQLDFQNLEKCLNSLEMITTKCVNIEMDYSQKLNLNFNFQECIKTTSNCSEELNEFRHFLKTPNSKFYKKLEKILSMLVKMTFLLNTKTTEDEGPFTQYKYFYKDVLKHYAEIIKNESINTVKPHLESAFFILQLFSKVKVNSKTGEITAKEFNPYLFVNNKEQNSEIKNIHNFLSKYFDKLFSKIKP